MLESKTDTNYEMTSFKQRTVESIVTGPATQKKTIFQFFAQVKTAGHCDWDVDCAASCIFWEMAKQEKKQANQDKNLKNATVYKSYIKIYFLVVCIVWWCASPPGSSGGMNVDCMSCIIIVNLVLRLSRILHCVCLKVVCTLSCLFLPSPSRFKW